VQPGDARGPPRRQAHVPRRRRRRPLLRRHPDPRPSATVNPVVHGLRAALDVTQREPHIGFALLLWVSAPHTRRLRPLACGVSALRSFDKTRVGFRPRPSRYGTASHGRGAFREVITIHPSTARRGCKRQLDIRIRLHAGTQASVVAGAAAATQGLPADDEPKSQVHGQRAEKRREGVSPRRS
jgi:hypothetical protein